VSDALVAVAVSGGRDSMALLHCTARLAPDAGLSVLALHVHHGLMAEADDWASFVEKRCAAWRAKGMPIGFAMKRLVSRPARGQSVEAWARAGRYAALAEMARAAGSGLVLLGHHQGDQAETFLLQALRGAGPAGLAAMPASAERGGIVWARPWLRWPREAIEAYARRHRIAHVDDASNADTRFARNRLRAHVLPTLRQHFADADGALAAAAQGAARARALIDEVAAIDCAAVRDGEGLVLSRWRALSAVRQRECLRAWLAPVAEAGLSEALLERLLVEVPARADPARWRVDSAIELRRYRGRLTLSRERDTARRGVDDAWRRLIVTAAAPGQGVPRALLDDAQWRERLGDDRFQPAASRPARSLKKQFQAVAMPSWVRDMPVLVDAQDALIFVPGLGTDARALAREGAPRVDLAWRAALPA
jgi:tRNA(Ile)-lysidine synthase